MDDTERRTAKRSRFDQKEPEPRKASRFDRRSRSPSARKEDSARDRSPLDRERDADASAAKSPVDPAAAAGKRLSARRARRSLRCRYHGNKSIRLTSTSPAAAAAKINAQLQARKGIQHVDVPPIRSEPSNAGAAGPPGGTINGEMYIADGDYIKDIEVNDLRNRYTLTKGSTQKMVNTRLVISADASSDEKRKISVPLLSNIMYARTVLLTMKLDSSRIDRLSGRC